MSGKLHSTVTLLQRFLYFWKNICLNKNKRYQIRSRFIFEETIKKELAKQGFQVTDIKRINRKEFDVVTILEGVVHNFQCKNNLVDLCSVVSDQKKFIRYNRYLNSYYRKALIKEKKREQLLLEEIGLTEIHHYILSKFPIVTKEPRIVLFNNIANIRQLIN